MSRYFCLCPGGIKSDKDVSVPVESFREIGEILDIFAEEIPHTFVKYQTQFILDQSPIKFPKWGKTYMVLGITKDGQRFPLGYCNFEKKWSSSISAYSCSLWMMFILSFIMAVLNLSNGHFIASMWCAIVAMLTSVIFMLRKSVIIYKFKYLLK